MSQHDFTIDNQTFPTTRQDINNALEALATMSSGPTAPSTTRAYMLWHDTTAEQIKQRNADDDAWITLFTIDQATDTVQVSGEELVDDQSPQLGADLDTNGNDINFGDDDKAVFGAGSDLQIYHTGSTSYIFEQGDGDLRIRGNEVRVEDADGSTIALFQNDAGAQLRHNGTPVLETQSGGIDVTGTVTARQSGSSGYYFRGYRNSSTSSWYVYDSGSDVQMTVQPANALRFGTSNSERMRIDSSGNVGIGTTSPNSALNVNSGTANTNTTFESSDATVLNLYKDSGGSAQISSTSGDLKFATGGDTSFSGLANNLVITSGGNVGIGTTSPNASVSISKQTSVLSGTGNSYGINLYPTSSGATYIDAITGGSGTTDLALRTYNNGTYNELIKSSSGGTITSLQTAGTERMRIDSSGNVLVGATDTDLNDAGDAGFVVEGNGRTKIATNGSEVMQINRSDADTNSRNIILFYRNGSEVGSITGNGSSTSYNTSSDYRLKENIADADNAGSKIDGIQVRQFDWIADGSHQDYGMIAQELQTVAPEAVSGDADSDEMMSVDYSKLVPMLIKEVQSLRARVAELENN